MCIIYFREILCFFLSSHLHQFLFSYQCLQICLTHLYLQVLPRNLTRTLSGDTGSPTQKPTAAWSELVSWEFRLNNLQPRGSQETRYHQAQLSRFLSVRGRSLRWSSPRRAWSSWPVRGPHSAVPPSSEVVCPAVASDIVWFCRPCQSEANCSSCLRASVSPRLYLGSPAASYTWEVRLHQISGERNGRPKYAKTGPTKAISPVMNLTHSPCASARAHINLPTYRTTRYTLYKF